MEHTKLRNRVVSYLVKVSNAQLCVSVLLSLHVDLQLQVAVDLVVSIFVIFEEDREAVDFGFPKFEFLSKVAAISLNSVKLLKDKVEPSLQRVVVVLQLD